jgi:excisionase family DNA binding protein
MARVFDRVAVESWLKDEIVQKFPRGGLGDIRLGSPCIVNPGEVALFVRGGKSLGTFEPGTHVLTTANVPWLTDLIEGGLFGGKNVFTADVYFVKTTNINVKWGTATPILVRHPHLEPGGSAIIGNGTFRLQVKDPWRFLNAIDGFRESVRLQTVKEYIAPEINVMMQDKVSELINAKNVDPFNLQQYTGDVNKLLVGLLQPEFDAEGLTIMDLNVGLQVHPDNLKIIAERGIVSAAYMQKLQADAFLAAAQSEGGGGTNLGELGMGMMGMTSAQQMQAMMQQQQQMMQPQQQQAQQQPQQEAPASGGSDMPAVMTPAQAAEVVQVTEADIVAAIEAGDLKARKNGSAYRISRANLEEFLGG